MRSVLLILLSFAVARAQEGGSGRWDVVVYGGTSAGVIAAVQGARMGKQVALLVPGDHVGGMTASGLGMTDLGNARSIGGLADEFYARIYRHYLSPAAWRHGRREDFLAWLPKRGGIDGRDMVATQRLYVFEPRVAERVFETMLAEAKVKVVRRAFLDLEHGVEKQAARITAIRLEEGVEYAAKVFIDATYEGDLLAKAGVSYTVGREANSRHGETLNGMYPKPSAHIPIAPCVVPGDPSSGLLPPAVPQPPGKAGDGDNLVQSYNFRLCLTDVPENRVPIAKPDNYDPLNYEAFARYIGRKRPPFEPGPARNGAVMLGGKGGNLGINFDLMPNRKTDSNDGSFFGSDLSGGSQGWPEGTHASRKVIWRRHHDYLQGLLWFLGNDPRVPEKVRTEMSRWGLAKDEFTDNGNWPYQLYVREARRMISDYVITEHDAFRRHVVDDGVALASYPLDSHSGRYYVDGQGKLWRESGFFVRNPVFPVSYRAIRPKAEECTNLLVAGCLSATHAAYGSVRMEPVFMMLGQAAGTAACIAIDDRVPVQEVSYPKLKKQLEADRQQLDAPAFDEAAKPS